MSLYFALLESLRSIILNKWDCVSFFALKKISMYSAEPRPSPPAPATIPTRRPLPPPTCSRK